MRCLEVGIMDLVRVVAYSVESVDRISTESDIFQLLMSVSELSSSLKLREDQTGTGETVDTPGQHIQNKDCPSQTGTG